MVPALSVLTQNVFIDPSQRHELNGIAQRHK